MTPRLSKSSHLHILLTASVLSNYPLLYPYFQRSNLEYTPAQKKLLPTFLLSRICNPNSPLTITVESYVEQPTFLHSDHRIGATNIPVRQDPYCCTRTLTILTRHTSPLSTHNVDIFPELQYMVATAESAAFPPLSITSLATYISIISRGNIICITSLEKMKYIQHHMPR